MSRRKGRAKARRAHERSVAVLAWAPSSAASPVAGQGAAIGAAVGGATGAVVASQGQEHLQLPAETRLQFQLSAAITVKP